MIYIVYKVNFESGDQEIAIPEGVCILNTLEKIKLEYGKANALFFKYIKDVSDSQFIHIKSLVDEFATEI